MLLLVCWPGESRPGRSVMLEGGRLCLPAGSSWRAAIFAGSTQGDRALQELWCRPRARETLRRLCIPRAQLQHRAAPRPWCGRAPPHHGASPQPRTHRWTGWPRVARQRKDAFSDQTDTSAAGSGVGRDTAGMGLPGEHSRLPQPQQCHKNPERRSSCCSPTQPKPALVPTTAKDP